MNWRLALVFGVVFVVVGSIYWWIQTYGVHTTDLEGATLLLVLGIAMAFGFTVLLRGSRDL